MNRWKRYVYLGVASLVLVAEATIAQAQLVYVVTNGADTGVDTLRDVIGKANLAPGKDTIHFQIPPIGTLATIQLASPLPTITNSVTIDGWSQIGGPTNKPGIELDGSLGAPATMDGLYFFRATNCQVMGLCINQMPDNGIYLQLSSVNEIYGNWIGTDTNGTSALSNGGHGIYLWRSQSNSIGLLSTTDATNRNIISGNTTNGINIRESNGNEIQNNYIGTDVSGLSAIPNQWSGVEIMDGSSRNNIGSTAGPKPVNIISGNGYHGVHLSNQASHNKVFGNHIGVDRTGMNALGNAADGVNIEVAGSNEVGDSGGESRNVISGNTGDGVELVGASMGNIVRGNYIGVASNGLAALPNGDDGVALFGVNCMQNTIGDTVAAGRNIISGNAGCGVKIEYYANGNLVYGNYIGVNRDGLAAVSNREWGVLLTNKVTGNRIGNDTLTNSGNLISGNASSVACGGIGLHNRADENTISRNIIGLSVINTQLFNMGDGIQIVDSGTNLVGGVDPDDGNVISGNAGDGVQIGPGSHDNQVLSNIIGLDTNGTASRANTGEGVFIFESQRNQIGVSSSGNIISGNAGSGIKISNTPQCRENTIGGNRIGTDISASYAIGNSDKGIWIYNSPSNVIGGTSGQNVISGNDTHGIVIQGTNAVGNQVLGNVIGADMLVLSAISNGQDGIFISGAPDNIIGDYPAGANDISGNGRYGVLISGYFASRNKIVGNRIGVNSAGKGIPNQHSGVVVHNGANNNSIGTTNWFDSNEIAYNNSWGVLVITDIATNNSILCNSIHGNGLLGIDLTNDGVTPNDDQDPDVGPNFYQNYPVIYSATTGSIHIGAGLNSRPNTEYRIEFFTSSNGHYSGHGQGQTFLGFTNVTTEADGNVSNCFFIAFSGGKTGDYITATATDPYGNTSEFSAWVRVVPDDEVFDADGDGMPNDWEDDHGLDPYDRTGDEGADGDPDTDYTDNFNEYVADTDPQDSTNYFHFTVIDHPDNTIVTYTSTNSRYYIVSYATNMNAESWTDLYASSVQGSNGTTTTNDVGTTNSRMYRVQVQIRH